MRSPEPVFILLPCNSKYDKATEKATPNLHQIKCRKRQRREGWGELLKNLWSYAQTWHHTADTLDNYNPTKTIHEKPSPSQKYGEVATKGRREKRETFSCPPIQGPERENEHPVCEPGVNDVLVGRGSHIKKHSGNIQFWCLVEARKKRYMANETTKLERTLIATGVMQNIRSMKPPGRFLKKGPDGKWFEIEDSKARKKVGRALKLSVANATEEHSGVSSLP